MSDNPNKKHPSKMNQKERLFATETMLQRYADDFEPTRAMYFAKSRLQAHIEATNPHPGTITPEYIIAYCGSPRAREWITSSPEFVYWILDKDTAKHRMLQLRDLAVDVLESVARGEHGEVKYNSKGIQYVSETPVKDKVKAAEILMNYTDSMPAKRKETKYLDEGLAKMTDSQLDKKLEEARKSIAGDAYDDWQKEQNKDE